MKNQDPLTRAVEDWSGHAESHRQDRRILFWMITAGLLVVLLLLFTSCVSAKGNRTTGDWSLNSVGTDATTLNVGPDGMGVTGLNQSASFKATLAMVKKLWSDYLIAEGLKWVAGKYYDHQNNLVNQDTTLKLENLRNAKSEADAKVALETLKANHAAAAAGATTTPGPSFDPNTGLNTVP